MLARAQSVPNVAYQGPITITQGGTYTGNYRSTDSGTPAVTIATSAPVTLQGCVLVGPGDLIQANGTPGDITVLNSQAFGTTPTQDNRYRGRFIAATNARNIRAENNYLEHTTGFTIYQFSGDGSANQTVRILRNKVLDIDGRTRNGGTVIANFVGLNTVRSVAGIEIAWNQVINEPNLSSVEDNINLYNSGGTAQSPARVHNNYVQGAYPFPATATYFSGTGMTTDGNAVNSASETAAFVNAYNNQFISTCNAGMNIAAGHDISYYNNRIVTSALLPDGTALRAVYAATAVFNGNQAPASIFYNNSIRDNTIGYRSPGYTIPFPDRHDLSNGACATCTNTTHLPNPITPATEQNEFVLWQQKLTQNGITLGVAGSVSPNTPPANGAPVVSLSAPGSGTVGAALALAATASDPDGTVAKVEFFSGAIKLGEDLSAPYTFSFAPTAAGTLSLTARATDNAGAATSSAATSVNVTAPTSTFYRALNLGGPALSIDGRAWEAAAGAPGFATNAAAWARPGAPLSPATDAARTAMLTSALFGTGPTLALAVPNATYSVFLYVWEDDNPVTITVLVEGQPVRSGYSTGAAGHWERLGPFVTTVADGTLNVATTGGNVNLSGLEVYRGTSAGPATPPANGAPVVSLSAPGSGTVGAALALAATASDPDGTVAKVEFFSGAIKLGEDLSAPYTFSFAPTAAGTLSLTARATDNAGAATSSAATSVNVTAPTSTFYRALNLGGPALSIDGRAWEAAAGAPGFATNAAAWARPGAPLSPATDAARTAMLTSALFGTGPTLALAVPNATYSVFLYVWEDDNPVTITVLVEGQPVRSGYSTGAAGHWERLGPFVTTVADGTLNVATTGGNVNLSGLEVYRGTVAAGARASLSAPAQAPASALSMYPNPVIASTQLQLPVAKAEEVEVGIFTMQGNPISRQRISVEPNTPSLPIPTNNLTAGNYILRVLSGSQQGKSIRFAKE